MTQRFELTHDGRHVEVTVVRTIAGPRAALSVDGRQIAMRRAATGLITLTADGSTVHVRCNAVMSVFECVLVDGDHHIELRAEPGSAGAHRQALARRYPRLYGLRRVLSGMVEVGLVVLAVHLFAGSPLPLPGIALPDLSLDLPPWVPATLDTMPYWMPILIGLVTAAFEHGRRRRRRPAAPVTVVAGARPAHHAPAT